MYEFFWNLSNRVRHALGKKCLPRRCCRDEANLVHRQVRLDLTVGVCRKCGSRHFGLTVNPAVIGLRGSAIG